MGDMENVVELTLSEDQLFDLPSFVDDLWDKNPICKEDGVFKFHICPAAREDTPLLKLINLHGDELQNSLKRLNPISVSQSPDFYGHLSTGQNYLEADEVLECQAVLKNPAAHEVSDESNCCMSALTTNDVSGLLKHYFKETLPSEAKKPPQCHKPQPVGKMKRRARCKGQAFKRYLQKVHGHGTNEQMAEELRKALTGTPHEESYLCCCWMCTSSDEVLVVEKNNDDDDVKTCPAATAKYYKGKGFMYASGVNVPPKRFHKISRNFSLSFLSKLSLTSLLGQCYPGISTSYLYFGFIHSFFAVHIEDLSLWSVNFLHHGYPKVWIVIPPHAVAKLNECLSQVYTYASHSTCMARLTHKYHFPSPSWLTRHGIPFKVVVQRKGQSVVVAPTAAHFGFNLGPNIAEAINFGSYYWIPYGIVYPKCTCMVGQIHGDLSTIICTYCPEMLQAYQERKIPSVPDQKSFSASIVYPSSLEQSNENSGVFEVSETTDCDEDVSSDGDTPLQQPKRLKKCTNRKQIICPVCNLVYQGGHKKRLMEHIAYAHSNLADEDRKSMQEVLDVMFPLRHKLEKKECNRCGKFVARSMKSHQASSACEPVTQ